MTRWLWIALALGCSGEDKEIVAADAEETDTTLPAPDTDLPPDDTDETVVETDETVVEETDPPTGPTCLAVDPTTPVVPLLPAIGIDFEEDRVLYGMPATAPKAVVLFFHGSGGSAADVNGTEVQALMNQLVPFGWGYVAAESEDQDPGNTWDTSQKADNPDMARVVRVLDHVAGLTTLEADTPIVAMGFSNGGSAVAAFVAIYGDTIPVVAASFHNTAPRGFEDVPAIWFAAVNDAQTTPGTMEAAYQDTLQSGQQTEYHLQAEQVISVGMLQRNPEIDAAEADALFADMVASGLVAADGTRLVQGDGDAMDKALNGWAAQSAVPGALRASDLSHRIWALHRFIGYQADVECAFLTGLVP